MLPSYSQDSIGMQDVTNLVKSRYFVVFRTSFIAAPSVNKVTHYLIPLVCSRIAALPDKFQ